MRRRILAIIGLAALVLTPMPAAAATGGNAFHFSATGKGAEAGWSTFPADGIPVVNVVYTDTFVFASEDAITQDGEVFSDKFAFIDQFSYKFDRRGNFVPVSEIVGFAGGNDVNLSVDSKLKTASLSANVALQTCDEHGCTDLGIGSLVASWTGQGDIIRQIGTFHVTSKTFTESGQFRGSFRNANAVGSLDGVSFGGTQFFADIFNSTNRDVFICHGC